MLPPRNRMITNKYVIATTTFMSFVRLSTEKKTRSRAIILAAAPTRLK
jgi:hypothetical protein